MAGKTTSKASSICTSIRKSRTKPIEEDIKDDVDLKIFTTFTVDELKLPKDEFNEVATDRRDQLTPEERKRLTIIRQTLRNRQYSERKRRREIIAKKQREQAISDALRENHVLRNRVEAMSNQIEALTTHIDILTHQFTVSHDKLFDFDE